MARSFNVQQNSPNILCSINQVLHDQRFAEWVQKSNICLITSCFFGGFFCYLVALWLHVPANSLSQEENEGKYEVKIGHAATLFLLLFLELWKDVELN